MAMKIDYSSETTMGLGNFGALVEGDLLVLPLELKDINTPFGLRSAEEFHAVVEAFPNHFMQSLGWTAHDFARARQILRDTLDAAPAAHFMHRRDASFGARSPRH